MDWKISGMRHPRSGQRMVKDCVRTQNRHAEVEQKRHREVA